jgi:hypothetical protein
MDGLSPELESISATRTARINLKRNNKSKGHGK